MSDTKQQNLKNHGRLDPTFHIFLFGILAVTLILTILHLIRHFDFHSAWMVVLALAAIVLLFKVRIYALKVQDRVIRLEERLRLKSLTPAEWHPQIERLSEDQLIGLRFASDGEVVELAKKALAENLNRKQIKERIQNWRADHWRV